MKIIDFEKKGNLVRFYLGDDDCNGYWGDDWDDRPYECNAGRVYDEYIKGHRDIVFPFDYAVVEPCDGYLNSPWCKEDMKARKVPCTVAVANPDWEDDTFDRINADDKAVRFYFGDKMEPSEGVTIFVSGTIIPADDGSFKVDCLGN